MTTTGPTPARIANERQASRVLLVARDPAFDAALSWVLEDAGFAVRSVANARAALLSVAWLCPEIVVIDLDAEGEDGFGFLNELARADLGIRVVVSSRDPSLVRLDATGRRRLGLDAVLQGPCRLEAIAETLRALPSPAAPRVGSGSVVPVPPKRAVARLGLARVLARTNAAV